MKKFEIKEPEYTAQELLKQQVRFYTLVNGTLTTGIWVAIPAIIYLLVAAIV